jgi:hypothetical protein
MSMHLCAYFNPTLTNTVDSDTPALTDSIMYIQNSHFLPQKDMYVYASYAISTLLVRAKLSSPKIRQINPVYIRFIDFGGNLPSSNPNMDIKKKSPFLIRGLEELQVLATSTTGTNEKFLCLLWLMDSLPTPAPVGDVYTVRCNSTVAAVANTWTNVSPGTFEQVLPYGTYTVIDSEYFAANAQAHRLIFDQQYFRPGNLGFATNHSRYPYSWFMDQGNSWGSFMTTNLPRQEVLNNATDAAHEFYYHVVKTG